VHTKNLERRAARSPGTWEVKSVDFGSRLKIEVVKLGHQSEENCYEDITLSRLGAENPFISVGKVPLPDFGYDARFVSRRNKVAFQDAV
jgi:hypothetical protein